MKFEIKQTITQTITRIVEAEDRAEATALIYDADFRESIEKQRMEEWETEYEDWEVKKIPENPSEPIYHHRKCDVTGEGMDCGWVCGDDYYIKYEEDLIKHLRDVFDDDNLNGEDELTDDELRNKYYQDGYFYYTEWDDPEDIMYVETYGKVRLMKNSEKPL